MSMDALQVHYTSCRNGRMGSPGFQVRAASSGLSIEDQRECERLGVYKAPLDAPDEPDADQIGADYPLAFQWHRLPSGRWVLVRSRYAGQDYSGRWGNFFAHSLVIVDEQPEFWPIDYYEWSGWVDHLSPEEDDEAAVADLEPVDLGEIEPAGSFCLDELAKFLADVPDGTALLARMIRAMFAGRSESRSLVVRDSHTNGLYWVACLQKALPWAHARELTSSTYVHDPRRCAAINATCGQTNFAFDATERRFQFYIFDLETGLHSEIGDADDDYAAAIADCMARRPEDLDAFHALMGRIDHHALDPEALRVALRLCEIVEFEAPAPTGSALLAVIDFARRHAPPDIVGELVRRCATFLDPQGPRLDDAIGAEVIRFVAEAAIESGERPLIAHAVSAWSKLAARVLGGAPGAAACAAVHQRLIRAEPSVEPEMMAKLLEDARARERAGLGPPASIEALDFSLRMLWRAARVTGRRPRDERALQTTLAALIDKTGVVRAAEATFGVAGDDPEGLTEALHALVQVAADDDKALCAIGQTVSPRLAALGETRAWAVRATLDEPPCHLVLLADWSTHVKKSADDPIELYRRYHHAASRCLPRYTEARAVEIPSLMFEVIPAARRGRIARDWLRQPEAAAHSELARRCLQWVNEAMGIAADLSAETLDELEAWVSRHGVTLRPDCIALTRASLLARASDAPFDTQQVQRVQKALDGIDEARFGLFLDRFLGPALTAARRGTGHRAVLFSVASTPHAPVLQKRLAQFFDDTDAVAYDLEGAIEYWVVMNLDRTRESLAPVQATVVERLARRAAAENPNVLVRLTDRPPKGAVEAAAWKAFEARVEHHRLGTWGRLKSFFRRR